MSFWKSNEKKIMNSEEFEALSKKIVSLELQIETLKHKNILFDTELADIRNKVLKKLNSLRKTDIEETEEQNIPKQLNRLSPFGI